MTLVFYDAASRELLMNATKADGVPRKGDHIQLRRHPMTPEMPSLPPLARLYRVVEVVWEFSGGPYLDYSDYSNLSDRVHVYLDPLPDVFPAP